MDRMGKWADVSMAVFENKWLLLKAEHSASFRTVLKPTRLPSNPLRIMATFMSLRWRMNCWEIIMLQVDSGDLNRLLQQRLHIL